MSSLAISQAILESGWGVSELAKVGDNLFGIKKFDYPIYVTVPTYEYFDGNRETINADFRKYNNWSESILDHAIFFVENPRYTNLISCTDYKKVCRLIHQDGYAQLPMHFLQ